MDLYTPEEIYIAFRKAQAFFKNRGYRLPKDFEKHLETKMSAKNKEALILATKYFNTKWNRIDVERYMLCGFEIFKSYTYTQFFNRKVMNLYIQKDKNIKRDIEINKKSMVSSLKFIKQYMNKYDIPTIGRYLLLKVGNQTIVIKHYMENKIDKYFLIWLIKEGLFTLSDDDRILVPYIIEQYRECLDKLNDIRPFLIKLKNII